MAYRIAAIPMTLSDREGYSPFVSLLNGILRTVVEYKQIYTDI